MAAGDTMQGRRLPDGDDRLLTDPSDAQPGDYGLYRGYTGDKLALMFVLPTGERGHITFPPHEHEVHDDDGTITVRPSILHHRDGGWHGYLERGVWREV
jgi:hypothetical protein